MTNNNEIFDRVKKIIINHLGAEAPAAFNALQNLQRQGTPQISAEGMSQVIELVWRNESVGQKPMPQPDSYFWPTRIIQA